MGLFDRFKKKKEEKAKVEQEGGNFLGFVLLEDGNFDWKALVQTMKEDWNLQMEEPEEDGEEYPDSHVFTCEDCMIVLGLVDMPIPNHEAEENAARNYMWREAVERTQTHKANLIVSVMGKDVPMLERSKLYVKVTASCCKQQNVVGIYTSGVVFEPAFYIEAAEIMRDGNIPLLNLVWFGIYQTEKGISGYTYGLNSFGKDEIEVLDTSVSPAEVREFLLDMVSYVLEADVVLRDGETIGFSAEQKLPITRSKGVALEGMTLKIEYGKAE